MNILDRHADQQHSRVRAHVLLLNDTDGFFEGTLGVKRLRQFAAVSSWNSKTTQETICSADILIVIGNATAIDASLLQRVVGVKLVVQTGSDAHHIDAEACRVRGVEVVMLGRTPRLEKTFAAVAELTMFLMIACVRKLATNAHHTVMCEGDGWSPQLGRTLSGKRLGILGCGRLGSQVARLAQAFGMEVVAWKRDESYEKTHPEHQQHHHLENVQRVTLRELLVTCDVISVHLRLSPESENLLGLDELSLCRRGAILINTASSKIVNTRALVRCLEHGPLGAAGLDVFDEEPLPLDAELRLLPNVVITPHISSRTEECFEEWADIATKTIEEHINNK